MVFGKPMNDRKTIFAWCMYDWANSAFILTVVTAVLPIYFASAIVPEGGVTIGETNYSATALWGLAISAAGIFIFLFAPLLGTIADYTYSKKKFLLFFCYAGSMATLALFFSEPGDVQYTITLLIIAQIGFVGGNIFYDAFLPVIASPDKTDWVSGKGFAFGYVGGGVQLLLALLLISFHDMLGLDKTLAVRIGLAMAGLWWGGFAVFTFLWLKEPVPTQADTHRESLFTLLHMAIRRLAHTLRQIRSLRPLLIFLIAFMLYNEGIQTVIVMATIYGEQELKFSSSTLMLTLLIVQTVAMFGALGFSKLAERIGTKAAIVISLLIWCGIVIYAYFMTSPAEYLILGVFVGLVLGGSQSLSRSLYAAMIPVNASAEFFSFFTVFTRFSSIWGPMVFALIDTWTGSARLSIISLIVFFFAGIALLLLVNTKKASSLRQLSVD